MLLKSFVHTSTGVDLQLPVDVALVHEGVKYVQDTVHIPDFGVAPQEFNLLFRLFGSLTAVLTEGLKLKTRGVDGGGSMSQVSVFVCHIKGGKKAANLVNELVDDVPQPLIWQL